MTVLAKSRAALARCSPRHLATHNGAARRRGTRPKPARALTTPSVCDDVVGLFASRSTHTFSLRLSPHTLSPTLFLFHSSLFSFFSAVSLPLLTVFFFCSHLTFSTHFITLRSLSSFFSSPARRTLMHASHKSDAWSFPSRRLYKPPSVRFQPQRPPRLSCRQPVWGGHHMRLVFACLPEKPPDVMCPQTDPQGLLSPFHLLLRSSSDLSLIGSHPPSERGARRRLAFLAK